MFTLVIYSIRNSHCFHSFPQKYHSIPVQEFFFSMLQPYSVRVSFSFKIVVTQVTMAHYSNMCLLHHTYLRINTTGLVSSETVVDMYHIYIHFYMYIKKALSVDIWDLIQVCKRSLIVEYSTRCDGPKRWNNES